MSGRRTKGGMHYSEEDRRDIVTRAADMGLKRAARMYGVSEASIKTWRQEFGIQPKNMDRQTMGGSMDRYFCRSCEHGCAHRSTFTGCTYILDTGEHRPHKNGWCLGFAPKPGTHQGKIEAYRRETAKHEEDDSEDDDGMVQDEVIIKKTRGYTGEEKARVLDYAMEHTLEETTNYFNVSDVSVSTWRKEAAKGGYRKLTAEDVPDVPDVPDNDIGGIAETLPEPVVGKADSYPAGTWDDWDKDVVAQLRERIGELERQAERYRRALGILEGV